MFGKKTRIMLLGPKRIRLTLARAVTGFAEKRGPRFGIIERKGDVRCSITVDEGTDKTEGRDTSISCKSILSECSHA
jgi:hypothetical protein